MLKRKGTIYLPEEFHEEFTDRHFDDFAGIASAQAADMPMYTKAPAAVAVMSWTGFYFGGHIGGMHSEQTSNTVFTPAGFGAPGVGGGGVAGLGFLPFSTDLKRDGILGGVHAGYNWQVNQWVYGIEGDVSFIDRDRTNSQTIFTTFAGVAANGTYNVNTRNEYLASVRGRLGYTWGQFMLYGTGGAAFTETKYNVNFATAGIVPAFAGAASFSNSNVGYVLGGGGEYMFTPNWTVRAEYLYYRFDGSNNSTGVVEGSCTAAVGCAVNTAAGELEFHTFRAGLSYKF